MTKAFTIALFLAVALQGRNLFRSSAPPPGNLETVAFCDLIRNPKVHDQKTVRIKAIYRYGYEWSELYCLDCIDAGKVWVELDDSFATNTDIKLAKRIGDNGFPGRTVSIVAVGEFYGTGGGYGHQGSYRYKFRITRLEQASILLNDSPIPAKLPKSVLPRVRC
jgi:hypothetical protein